MRNTIRDEKVASKLDTQDKEKLNKAIDDTIHWMDAHQNASKEEYDAQQKELESVAMPIMTKLYQSGGGAPGGFPGGEGFPGGQDFGGNQPGSGSGNTSGPRVEEVD